MDLTRPAGDVWSIKRKPVDILGRMMFRLDFHLVGWQTTVHYKMVDTLKEAEQEVERIRQDMEQMLDGPFRTKYKIAHDLRAGF